MHEVNAMSVKDMELLLAQQQAAIDLERAKTAVANGRAFVVLLFALIMAVAALVDKAALWLALLPLASIGAAYLADGVLRRYQPYLSIVSIVCALASLLIIFYL
jgi:hypothetical protein